MKTVLIMASRAALAGFGVVALAACAPSGGESEAAAEDSSAASPLPAQALSVGTFGKVCGADIADFCSEVLPGSGRLQACLYAHQDLISDECFAANEQTGVMLETVFDGYYAFLEVCNADLNTVCSEVEQGGGAQLQCLKDNMSAISAECAANISK